MAIGKTGSTAATKPTLERLEQKVEREFEELAHDSQALGQSLVSKGWQQLAKVQTAIFDGQVGAAVSNPSTPALAKLGFDAFKPLPPAPELRRPVVMVTGLTMQAASYDPMSNHLASNPKNGLAAVYSLDDGRFHLGGVGGRVMGEAELKKTKLFQVQYTDVRGAPTEKAPQLAKAFAAIERVTRAPALDVVAHSAGCTDFRLYLDSRDQAAKDSVKFNQVMLVGPASHGTSMGNLGEAVGGPLGLGDAGRELKLASPLVTSLNATWDQQREQAKAFTIIGVGGAPTIGPNGLTNGDGFMAVDQLALPKAETVVLRGADPTPVAHLMEIGYSGVLGEIDQRLARD
jgi:hypothetical protein